MATRFELAHRGDLLGSLTTVDRLIVHGHLSRLWFANHMAYLLDRLGVHILRDFGRFMRGASDKVIGHAVALASKAGRPFIYQDRVVKGKDDLARRIAARDGVTEGLICVFSTVETAMCFALAGGAIRPRLRKCLHLYFYVIDRELGFMHIRLQTWFPFQIQVYLNGHEWLARQLERRGSTSTATRTPSCASMTWRLPSGCAAASSAGGGADFSTPSPAASTPGSA